MQRWTAVVVAGEEFEKEVAGVWCCSVCPAVAGFEPPIRTLTSFYETKRREQFTIAHREF